MAEPALAGPETEVRGLEALQPEAGGVALMIVDDQRHCLEASLAACRLLGVSREGVIGEPLDDFVAPGLRAKLEHFWTALRYGGAVSGPLEVTSAEAGQLPVHMSVSPNLVPGRHLVVLERERGDVEAKPRRGPTSPAPPATGLARPPSSRECQILGLLATGSTDEEIAGILELSPATVQTHVRNAKAKLGARTRSQAVAIAIRQRLIEVA